MRKAALSFPFLVSLALGGCVTSAPAPKFGPSPSGPSERSGEVTPWALTYGAALMTSKVYPHLAATADANANLFISPVSLSQGLGLAYLGARGATRDEIGRVLDWPAVPNAAVPTRAYNAQLSDTGDADITLGIANALWLAKGLPIRDEYVAEARSGFGAAPETVDYAGDPNDRFDLAAEQAREMRIILPRFEARFDESVKAALIAAGMPSAFDQQRADLSGIASGARLAIDDVAHATFLRVDEEGTEAAAATAVKIVVTSARMEPQVPEMVVDRPFLVTLRDRKSGAVLFFGRIADPTAIP